MLHSRIPLMITLSMVLCFDCMATIAYGIHNLTSSRVNDIEQDERGYIWIGSENGLNRFDEWNNVTFFHDPNDPATLKYNNVCDILSDTGGNLWIATGAGIQKYEPDGSGFSEIVFPGGIKPSVRSIIQTGPEQLMAVTSGYGVYSVDTRAMKAVNEDKLDEFIATKYAHLIRQDGLNRIWIAGEGGIIKAVDKNLRPLHTDKLPDIVIDIDYDLDNDIWAVTGSSLYRWDGRQSKFIRVEGTPELNITGLLRTNEGKILVHTLEDGVFALETENNSLRELKEYSDIKKDGILEMHQDRNGDIWCATLKGGIAMQPATTPQFSFLPLPTRPARNIECVTTDLSRGTVTAAFSDGVLSSFDSDLNPAGDTRVSGRVTAIYNDHNGNLLLGMDDGRLIIYDGKSEIPVNRFQRGVQAIAKDRKGNLYVGLSGDGFHYSSDRKNWKGINESTTMANPNKLGNNWINIIMPDHSGKIWLGHTNGVDIFDPLTNTFADTKLISDLRAHIVYAILEAKDGSVWIGTNYGLYQHKPDEGVTESFGKESGMDGNIICGIAESNNGDIWTSTNRGISRIRLSDGKVINYGTGGSMKEREFLKGMLLKGPDETIFIGGISGLTAFQPDAIEDHQPLASPTITGVQLNSTNERNPLITYSDDGESDIAATITLNHNQNTFSIELSNFNYRNPGCTEFEYRIPKLQKDWQRNPPGDNRVACSYLNPGKYIMEVRAVENGMTSPVTTILIHILPPWYLTVWAKLAYIILFCLTVAIVWYELRRNRLQRQKEEIAEEKFKMLYNFAHELRSPATLIISPLPSLIREERDERKAGIFRMMQRNGYRITDLVNKMLDIRRIEKGQLKLSFCETDLKEYMRPIIEDFRVQAESRGITLTFSAPDDPVLAYIDPDHFDKIIVNLISNALKFTPDGGVIDVTLRITQNIYGKGQAVMEVTDTGTGIRQEDISLLFERFYQGERKSDGFGIGLNLSKMLVDLHHGEIRAANRSDSKGALFEVSIPLGRTHLKDKEISTTLVRNATQRYVQSAENRPIANDNTEKKGGGKYRILIADDDEEIRDYLKSELDKYYKTVTASDGEEAYAIALEKQIDLIISDIMMPNTDGLSLLKQIRANADLTHIPIILLTSSEDFNTRMAGWEKGADAYLTKPFHIEELRQLCSSLISGRIRLKGRFSLGEKVDDKIEKVELKGNDELLLERITKAVNENIGNSEFGVEELAEAVGLSRVHLHRRMKALVGLAPRDFLKSIRLKRAAALLKQNTTTISQVGYMVGFSSPGQFSDSFRKYFGCSPSEYIARETEQTDTEEK